MVVAGSLKGVAEKQSDAAAEIVCGRCAELLGVDSKLRGEVVTARGDDVLDGGVAAWAGGPLGWGASLLLAAAPVRQQVLWLGPTQETADPRDAPQSDQTQHQDSRSRLAGKTH